MVALEANLEGGNVGICCDSITFMDVVIYNDIRTILVLYQTSLSNDTTPQLNNWFQNMTELCPPIAHYDNKFDLVCTNRGIGLKSMYTDTN